MSFHCQRVLNHQLELEGRQMIQMHKDADVIGLVEKNGFPYLLSVEDEDQPLEQRVFRFVTTGEKFNPEILEYIGTLRLGGQARKNAAGESMGPSEPWYTLHVFEIETALIPPHPDPLDPRFHPDAIELRNELTDR